MQKTRTQLLKNLDRLVKQLSSKWDKISAVEEIRQQREKWI